MDLIDRQDAIDVLSMMQGIVAENGVRKGISMAWQQIKDLPTANVIEAPGWIPVSERLPEANEKDENDFIKAYLVQDARWMDVARWDGEYWIAWGYGTVLKDVIAWMPLPKPYREEDANDKDYSSHQKLC